MKRDKKGNYIQDDPEGNFSFIMKTQKSLRANSLPGPIL